MYMHVQASTRLVAGKVSAEQASNLVPGTHKLFFIISG
jgi:hypothetical protein